MAPVRFRQIYAEAYDACHYLGAADNCVVRIGQLAEVQRLRVMANGLTPVYALDPRLNGPVDETPAARVIAKMGPLARWIAECLFGRINLEAIDQVIEIVIAHRSNNALAGSPPRRLVCVRVSIWVMHSGGDTAKPRMTKAKLTQLIRIISPDWLNHEPAAAPRS